MWRRHIVLVQRGQQDTPDPTRTSNKPHLSFDQVKLCECGSNQQVKLQVPSASQTIPLIVLSYRKHSYLNIQTYSYFRPFSVRLNTDRIARA